VNLTTCFYVIEGQIYYTEHRHKHSSFCHKFYGEICSPSSIDFSNISHAHRNEMTKAQIV